MKSVEQWYVEKYQSTVDKRIDTPATGRISPPSNAFFGFVFAAVGGIVIPLVIRSEAEGTGRGNFGVGIGVPTVFLLAGLAAMTYRKELLLDESRQSWRIRVGFLPFAKQWHGSLSAIDRIEVRFELRSTSGRQRVPSRYWSAFVVTSFADAPQIRVEFLSALADLVSEDQVVANATRFAEKLGVPVRVVNE